MNGVYRKWMIISSIFGALAVAIGAFGAHGLKSQLSEYQLDIFNTGNEYHFYHTIAMVIVAMILRNHSSRYLSISINAFTLGIVFFSGSLYLLATRDILGISSWGWLGPMTPIGGVLFIIGWLSLGIHFYKSNS